MAFEDSAELFVIIESVDNNFKNIRHETRP